MSKYYLVEEPDAGDVFGGFLVFIIIVAALFSFLLYIGAIALFIFLAIGVLIGGVYALIVYIKAFITACKSLSDVRGRDGFATFFAKLWQIEKITAITAFKNNFNVAKYAFGRAREFRLLSFRKWMWLIVAPSVILIGSAIILLVIMLQVGIVLWLLQIFLLAVGVAFLLSLLVSFGYSTWVIGKKFFANLPIDNPFKQVNFLKAFNFRFLKLFCKNYFVLVGKNIKTVWEEGKWLITSNLSLSGGYTILNVKKYILLTSPVAVMLAICIYVLLFVLVTVIAFIPLVIAETFWALFTTIFFKS